MSEDLYPGDGCVTEQAEKLRFHADQNSWETSATEIKVAKKMFAHGKIYGCIRFLDTQEKAVKVLKKAIKVAETVDDIHNGVKMQCLGELCAELFSSRAPKVCRTSFVPCLVYVLKQRPNQPSVRVEEFVEGKYEKREISVNPSRSATAQEILDSHKFAAFQFFTYIQSERNMVFLSALKVNEQMLTRPVVASLDQNLGGKEDRGSDGIAQWVAEFAHKYSPLLGLSKEQIFASDSEQLIALMDSQGLFSGRPSAAPPQNPTAVVSGLRPAVGSPDAHSSPPQPPQPPQPHAPTGGSIAPRTAAAAAATGPVAPRPTEEAQQGSRPLEAAARGYANAEAVSALASAPASVASRCAVFAVSGRGPVSRRPWCGQGRAGTLVSRPGVNRTARTRTR